jgi:hypothetical protein
MSLRNGLGAENRPPFLALSLVTVAEKPPVNTNRTERVLAYMILATIVVSIIAIFAALIGVGAGADASGGFWQVVVLLPSVGFPVAFALIITLVITSAVRRARAARDGGE